MLSNRIHCDAPYSSMYTLCLHTELKLMPSLERATSHQAYGMSLGMLLLVVMLAEHALLLSWS